MKRLKFDLFYGRLGAEALVYPFVVEQFFEVLDSEYRERVWIDFSTNERLAYCGHKRIATFKRSCWEAYVFLVGALFAEFNRKEMDPIGDFAVAREIVKSIFADSDAKAVLERITRMCKAKGGFIEKCVLFGAVSRMAKKVEVPRFDLFWQNDEFEWFFNGYESLCLQKRFPDLIMKF